MKDFTFPAVPESWRTALASEFDQPYMRSLGGFLGAQQAAGKPLFPPRDMIFHALEATPLEAVKVVILGQDPYHGQGQAHGLSFSVRPGVKVPPSLRNMYKELEASLGIHSPDHGCLESWAKQGVLLLNAVLTVEESKAGAHQNKGWEGFTDKIIEAVDSRCKGVVFILWGGYAQKKGRKIDRNRHLVLEGPHPSPLSAYRGFFGCGHFVKANDYLQSRGQTPIDWQVPPDQGGKEQLGLF